jgi:hypothetical protein
MAASNLAYHLAERGGVHEPGSEPKVVLALTALVVLTFVVIIWRVHRLLEGDHEQTPPSADGDVGTGDRTDEPRTEGRPEDSRTTRTEAPRTPPVRPGRTEGRTPRNRTARTAARTAKGRTAAPSRTDAEAIAILRGLPKEADGYVNVNAARTALSCNRDKAVRLLSEAGLLRPADEAKLLKR